MKAILSLIISGALVVAGLAQTRNVLVGTNNAVVQPTNFWSADASNARTGLGLGVSSNVKFNAVAIGAGDLRLSNDSIFWNDSVRYSPEDQSFEGSIGINNGSLQFVGTNAALNAAITRTNLNLSWSGLTNIDAPSFRTALGLGTASTNPASAFQASSANLTNLAANNGGSLTNLQATSLVGTIPASNISTVNFTNIGGTLSIASGGTGATNAANARQNLGSTTVGDAVFIATNAAAARTAIGALANTGVLAITNGGSGATTAGGARTNLGLGSLDNVVFNEVVAAGGVFSGTNASEIVLDTANYNLYASGSIAAGWDAIVWSFNVPFNFIGTNASSNKAASRTNLGIPWLGLTNTSASTFRTALEIGTTNTLTIAGVTAQNLTITAGGGITLQSTLTNASSFRTNIGLPWAGLTNSSAATFQSALFGANTNPVLVNTNGEVVSPTNFWQAAPINTVLQNITNVVGNATNAATNARMLFLYSLAPTVTNVTSTITLPTNGTTFGGDVATITHLGPTSSVTAIRALGASTNIITLNQIEESVRFIYRDNQWKLMDNISYIEPIFFSGTNAAANAAASRTNLGLGATWLTNTDVTNFRTAIGLGTTNVVGFSTVQATDVESINVLVGLGGISFEDDGQSVTRTNLGLPLAALTNTSVTNFQKAIFYTNTAPSNIGGNLGTIAAWIEIVASNGVTYKIPAYTNVP